MHKDLVCPYYPNYGTRMIEDILSFLMHVDESKSPNTFSEMVFLSMSISLCHPLGLSKVVGHQNNPSKPFNTISETNGKDSGILGKFRSPVGQMAVSRRGDRRLAAG